jgi:hypothetical protein
MVGVVSSRALAFLIALLFIVPPFNTQPTEAGSTWATSKNEIQNGTVANATKTAQGITLEANTTYIGNWTRISSGEPYDRKYMSAVYDGAHGDIIVYGGASWSNIGNLEDTWSYNVTTNKWTILDIYNNDYYYYWRQREGYGMAYDDYHQEFVMFGGYCGDSIDRTNILNRTQSSWNVVQSGTPSARHWHGMVFDTAAKCFIMFGGFNDATTLNDTWTYWIGNNTWVKKNGFNAPSPRAPYTMVYDRANNRTILFGGWDGNTNLNDTWEYNLGTDTWTQIPALNPPSARREHVMTYDSKRNITLLFGGYDSKYENDIYLFNYSDSTWTRLDPATPPEAVGGAAMVFDPANDETFLFGGYKNDDYTTHHWYTYNYSQNAWTNKTALTAPHPRSSQMVAYDRAADEILMVWGVYDDSYFSGFDNETWAYNISNQKWRYVDAGFPMARWTIPLFYNTHNETAIVFELGSPAMYVYNRTTSRWDTITINGITPDLLVNTKLVYDPIHNEAICFGGLDIDYKGDRFPHNNTYIFNFTTLSWTNVTSLPAPCVRTSSAGAFDGRTGNAVFFGGMNEGVSAYNDTWLFNTTTHNWTEVTKSVHPSIDYAGSMVYDENAGNFLYVFGGWIATNDTWAFNSTTLNWTKVNTARITPRTSGRVVVYDSRRGETVCVGLPALFSDMLVYNYHAYKSNGTYISPINDTGGNAYFWTIDYDADVPDNTSIRLQLRTGNTTNALNASQFVGSDGTKNSYYTATGQQIASIHNGSRFVQYKVYLGTTNFRETPTFKGATINYNLVQNAILTSPAGGENWTGTHDIIWTAADPDRDNLFVDIDLLDGIGETQLAYGLAADDWSWSWDTMGIVNGTYRIRLTVRDDNESIPVSITATSANFTITHPYINQAPEVWLSSPENGAFVNATNVNLSWNHSDPEGDNLTYQVFLVDRSFDEFSLPAALANTTDSHYVVDGLQNGTYYWAVIAFDGILNSTFMEVWNFTLTIPPPPNQLPKVELVSPADGATINKTVVEFSWNGSDADGDIVNYTLYLSNGTFSLQSLPAPIANATTHSYKHSGLTNGTTYYWAIVPWDGKENGTWSGIRSFTINSSYGNSPPQITSTPGLNATVGVTYWYNLTATDPEQDQLSLEVTATGSILPTVDSPAMRFKFTPTAEGNVTFTVTVRDGRGGMATQTFTVLVRPVSIPVQKPTGTITSSTNGSILSKTHLIAGTATGNVVRIEVSVDNGSWQIASGNTSWSLSIDTKQLSNGPHFIKVRAFDGTNNTDIATARFTVNNPKPVPPVKSDNTMLYAIGAIAAIAVVGGIGAMAMRKKKPAEDEKPEDEEETDIEDETVTKEEPEEEPEEAPEKEPEIEKPKPKKKPAKKPVEAKTEEAAAPAAATATAPAISSPAPKAEPKAPPAKTEKIAPEGFAVEDLFLMYNDGRLIMHQTRRLKADMDVDILTSMLKAVQEFVKESLGKDDNAELGAMEYGGSKIMMQKGKYVILAAVISGGEPSGFRDEMTGTISNIEGEFGPTLNNWDGVAAKLAGVKKFLADIGSYKPSEAPAQTTCKSNVSLKSELEFYQGFVRLKVAVKNECDTLIADTTFRLIYKDEVLRLDHIEPHYPTKGEEVQLGYIEPRVKKTMAFYLDPQICTESFLEGVLTFKDAHGNLEMLKLPRKMASVVCPIMYTDENVNTAMLKRMAVEELEKKDTKVFQIPTTLAHQKAFDLGKAAVQHHDVRLVREYTQKEPYIGEAWYYGKTKGRDDKLVIRARVIAENNVLEFFVASSSTLMLTGMLAELKADLNNELENLKGRPELTQVTDAKKVDALAQITTLLEKDETKI